MKNFIIYTLCDQLIHHICSSVQIKFTRCKVFVQRDLEEIWEFGDKILTCNKKSLQDLFILGTLKVRKLPTALQTAGKHIIHACLCEKYRDLLIAQGKDEQSAEDIAYGLPVTALMTELLKQY